MAKQTPAPQDRKYTTAPSLPPDEELQKMTPSARSQEISKYLTEGSVGLTDEQWRERYRQVARGPFGFEMQQRKAMMLSQSTLVPKEFQGNVANCAICVELADRMDMTELAVMQAIDVIQGRPSWKSQFIIGIINSCGKFKTWKYHITGEGMARACKIVAILKATGETVEGEEITMAMAKAEGWLDRNGSKWKTMPGHMLRLRAATFFGREFVADKLFGLPESSELRDIIDVTPEVKPPPGASGVAGAKELLASSDSR
jgi:hypothetical protein